MNTSVLIITFIGLIVIALIIYIYKIRTKKQVDSPYTQELNVNYQTPNVIELTDNYRILINQIEATDEINDFPEITDTKTLKRIAKFN